MLTKQPSTCNVNKSSERTKTGVKIFLLYLQTQTLGKGLKK